MWRDQTVLFLSHGIGLGRLPGLLSLQRYFKENPNINYTAKMSAAGIDPRATSCPQQGLGSALCPSPTGSAEGHLRKSLDSFLVTKRLTDESCKSCIRKTKWNLVQLPLHFFAGTENMIRVPKIFFQDWYFENNTEPIPSCGAESQVSSALISKFSVVYLLNCTWDQNLRILNISTPLCSGSKCVFIKFLWPGYPFLQNKGDISCLKYLTTKTSTIFSMSKSYKILWIPVVNILGTKRNPRHAWDDSASVQVFLLERGNLYLIKHSPTSLPEGNNYTHLGSLPLQVWPHFSTLQGEETRWPILVVNWLLHASRQLQALPAGYFSWGYGS